MTRTNWAIRYDIPLKLGFMLIGGLIGYVSSNVPKDKEIQKMETRIKALEKTTQVDKSNNLKLPTIRRDHHTIETLEYK